MGHLCISSSPPFGMRIEVQTAFVISFTLHTLQIVLKLVIASLNVISLETAIYHNVSIQPDSSEYSTWTECVYWPVT